MNFGRGAFTTTLMVVLNPDADGVRYFLTRAENLTAQDQIATENAN
jgi:hypothetical protein